MDKSAIKKYAIWARAELIELIEKKANSFGLTEKTNFVSIKDLKQIENRLILLTSSKQARALLLRFQNKGFKQTIEEIALTWFNRFNAIRFMEINGYLPDSIRVFSYKFKSFIVNICNTLNPFFPEMFPQFDDYSNLFLYDLLEDSNILNRLLTDIPEEDWVDNVQIIGWLYQFFNTEAKDKIFEDLKRNVKISKDKIPTATQLFTPEWVVKYMVENSLGRIWLESHNDQNLKKNWHYYLEEPNQRKEVKIELEKIREEYKHIRLEEIKCIDPCMGSGNILCYLFDVLFQLYREYGYSASNAVESIVKNNIYGLDIDEQVTRLAYFSLMMKARQYDKNFFAKIIQPNIYTIKESNSISKELLDYFCSNDKKIKDATNLLIEQMNNLGEYGSLAKISILNYGIIDKRIKGLLKKDSKYSFELQKEFIPMVKTAKILSQKYDVVVTNPPYMGGGGMNQNLLSFLKEQYPDTKADLFSAFMERGLDLCKPNGISCMVTMQNWMFIPSFEKFRKQIMTNYSILGLMQMENMVMGIAFGTSVSVIRNSKIPSYIGNYNYIKYSDIIDDKPYEFPVLKNRFVQISSENFDSIPGSPVAYWVNQRLLDSYKKGVIGDKYKASVGIQTGDNDRFMKFWFEVPFEEIDFDKNSTNSYKKKWYPHPKGGAFRKWYGNYDYVVNWQNNGEEIKAFNKSNISIKKYNQDGISWSHTTNGAFSARIFYKSSIPNLENPVLFCSGKEQKYLLAFLNSNVANYLLNMINSTMHYHVSDVLNLPLLNKEDYSYIETVVDELINLSKKDWDSSEYSWIFVRHPLYQERVELLSEAYKNYEKTRNELRQKLISNEEYLNNIFIRMYGVQSELTSNVEEKFVTIKKLDRKKIIKGFLSYAIGCVLGRYSIDFEGLAYAGGKWDIRKYKRFFPEKNNTILFSNNKDCLNDIIVRLEELISAMYSKEKLEENLLFIAESLGGKGEPREVIRNYFLNHFFKDHCKLYQKRPIYWLFDSGKKNAFKCLIYMHRLNTDTFTSIKTSVLAMKNYYSLQIDKYKQEIALAKYADKKNLLKVLKDLQNKFEEINTYIEKINNIDVSLFNINLDDGVKHNYALFNSVLSKIR